MEAFGSFPAPQSVDQPVINGDFLITGRGPLQAGDGNNEGTSWTHTLPNTIYIPAAYALTAAQLTLDLNTTTADTTTDRLLVDGFEIAPPAMRSVPIAESRRVSFDITNHMSLANLDSRLADNAIDFYYWDDAVISYSNLELSYTNPFGFDEAAFAEWLEKSPAPIVQTGLSSLITSSYAVSDNPTASGLMSDAVQSLQESGRLENITDPTTYKEISRSVFDVASLLAELAAAKSGTLMISAPGLIITQPQIDFLVRIGAIEESGGTLSPVDSLSAADAPSELNFVWDEQLSAFVMHFEDGDFAEGDQLELTLLSTNESLAYMELSALDTQGAVLGSDSIQMTVVPEPASILVLGLLGYGVLSRRRSYTKD